MTHIRDQNYGDWSVTVAFYSAVHYVESLFAMNGKHSLNHGQRNDDLMRQWPNVHRPFIKLYGLSLHTRYFEFTGDKALAGRTARQHLTEVIAAVDFASGRTRQTATPPSGPKTL